MQEAKTEQSHVLILDLCEQRPLNKTATYIFFNAQQQRVILKTTLETKRSFVQVVNSGTHIFFLERKICAENKRKQRLKLFAHLRGGSKLMCTLETDEHAVSKPACQLHDRWLLLIIPGVKSIAYDIFTQKYTDFAPLPLNAKQISQGPDLKTLVLNQRLLYVFNTGSKRMNACDIWSIDLHMLDTWRKLALNIENRTRDLSHFAAAAYNQIPGKSVLMFGGILNSSLQTYLLDTKQLETSQYLQVKTKQADRFCTNQVAEYSGVKMFFGLEYLHLFDGKQFEAVKYKYFQRPGFTQKKKETQKPVVPNINDLQQSQGDSIAERVDLGAEILAETQR